MQDVRYLYDALNKLKIASILCAIICTILLLLPIFIITLTSGALISSIFSPYLQLINNHVLTYVLSLVSLIMELGFITILIICIIIIILILISVFGFIIPALNSLKNYDHTRYGTIFNIVFTSSIIYTISNILLILLFFYTITPPYVIYKLNMMLPIFFILISIVLISGLAYDIGIISTYFRLYEDTRDILFILASILMIASMIPIAVGVHGILLFLSIMFMTNIVIYIACNSSLRKIGFVRTGILLIRKQ